MSRLCTELAAFLHNKFGDLFKQLNARRLTPIQLKAFAQAISDRGAPLQNVWAFLDGTVRPICRPGKYQRQAYNGHKRVHALKFQSVTTPDGIISHLTGPWAGKHHDGYLLSNSKLREQLEVYSHGPNREVLYIYGDPGYTYGAFILCPFKGRLPFVGTTTNQAK